MTDTKFPLDRLKGIPTPYYYYDMDMLDATLKSINAAMATLKNATMHYAIKANAQPSILRQIAAFGLGADCVSIGEIASAVNAGISPSKIVFAGVGKTDMEIERALDYGIFCFNVESIPELEVIDQIARQRNVTARVCLRINPDVDAHTHSNITTGLAENKFGIDKTDLIKTLEMTDGMNNIEWIGLHFHIGSQVLDLSPFQELSLEINKMIADMEAHGYHARHINVGGGLGIDYEHPEVNPIPDFDTYISMFRDHLRLAPDQHLHFELGRAIVGQCGSLITRVVYVKEGKSKRFAIVDAGMTDLIRPALYQATHKIVNLSSDLPTEQYDIVGPICESSDVFAEDYFLPQTHRNDILAIRSAGAYGQSMASNYNQRPLPKSVVSTELITD